MKENAAKLPLSGCDVVGNFTPRTYRWTFYQVFFDNIQQQDKRIATLSYINTLKNWKEGIREKKTNTRGSTKRKEEFFSTFISPYWELRVFPLTCFSSWFLVDFSFWCTIQHIENMKLHVILHQDNKYYKNLAFNLLCLQTLHNMPSG